MKDDEAKRSTCSTGTERSGGTGTGTGANLLPVDAYCIFVPTVRPTQYDARWVL